MYADGMHTWFEALEDHYWPCGVENVFMIDPDNDQKMGGVEMEEMFVKEYTKIYRLEGCE